jgi:hypothetical protein
MDEKNDDGGVDSGDTITLTLTLSHQGRGR